MKKVLVAIDGSAGSDRAVDFAAKLVTDPEAMLVIVNIVGGSALPGDLLSQITSAQNAWLKEALAQHSGDILRKAQERARQHGVARIQLESRDGDVAQTILDLAEQTSAEAVVVGKRGTGQVAGLLLGSVSQKLAALASKVVVIVP
jgi:nucleotide-binding universal stress UspA family protein